MDKLQANLKKIKLPKGFKIEVYASGIPQARQMAWGDHETLFVGSFLGYQRLCRHRSWQTLTVKTILKGMKNADRCRLP